MPEAPDDLAGHDLVAFRDRAPRRLAGPDGAARRFGPGASRLVVDDGASLRAAMVAGAGISASGPWSGADDLAAGRLVRVLPGRTVDDASALWLVYPKSNVLTAKVRVLIDLLTERIGRHPSSERGVRRAIVSDRRKLNHRAAEFRAATGGVSGWKRPRYGDPRCVP